MTQDYSEQEKIRRESLKKIIELGIDPYPAHEYPITTNSKEIKKKFSEKDNNFQDVSIAGRIMSRRIMGKASFMELKDFDGRIQIYLNRDELCPSDDKSMYNDVFKKFLDIGDIVGIKGYVFITKVGEISIFAKKLTVLSKSIKPLPIVKKDAEGNTHDEFLSLIHI